MKQISFFYIILLSLVILVSSCNKNDDLSDADLVLDLTDQFTASIYETFKTNGSRSMWVYLETSEEFACSNNALDVRYSKNGNDLYFDIKGLYRPGNEPCLEGLSKATTEIELGALDLNTYTIHLKLLDDLEEIGSLVNTSEYVDLTFPKNGWMDIVHERTFKVPARTVWGYFLNDNGHFDQLAADFIDGLEQFGSPLENDGFFGTFNIQQGQVKIIDNDQNSTTIYNGFGMNYPGEIELLEEWVVEHYCDEEGKIGLFSTIGELVPCD